MTAWCSISIVQVCCTALHVVDWLALLWGEMHQSAVCTDCMSNVGWSHGQIDTCRAYCAAVPPEGPSENSGKCSLSSTDLADCKEFQGSRTNVPLMQDNTDLPKFLWWCLENSCPFCSTGRHDPPRSSRQTWSSKEEDKILLLYTAHMPAEEIENSVPALRKRKIECLMDFWAPPWGTRSEFVSTVNVKSLWCIGVVSNRTFMDLSSPKSLQNISELRFSKACCLAHVCAVTLRSSEPCIPYINSSSVKFQGPASKPKVHKVSDRTVLHFFY